MEKSYINIEFLILLISISSNLEKKMSFLWLGFGLEFKI